MFKCTDSVGDLAIFVDLPGYGFAKMSKAQQEEVARFLRSYLEERGIYSIFTIDLKLLVENKNNFICMFFYFILLSLLF